VRPQRVFASAFDRAHAVIIRALSELALSHRDQEECGEFGDDGIGLTPTCKAFHDFGGHFR
jgi:hypothetical protein